MSVLIAGATRGIGLCLAQRFANTGVTVLATCRSDPPQELLECKNVEVIRGVDLVEEEGIKRLKQAVGDRKLSLFVHNAGIFTNETLEDMDFERILRQIKINALAPVQVAHALADNLQEGSKVALISSRMASIQDNGSGGYYGYRMSKAALNAAGRSLAMDWKAKGIAVALLHPGFVKTKMTGFQGDVTPEESAKGLHERIDQLSLENTGSFWHANGQELPW